MITTKLIFERRKKEISLFLNSVSSIEETNDFSIDFHNILHSNVLLMLYNLVESTVLGGILEIYDAVKTQGLTYKEVNSKIQDVWFTYKFNQVYDKNASHSTYKKKASEIIENILGESTVELNRKAVNISGNLDAKAIRIICNDHGINFTAPDESYGGYRISDVRDLRNSLAHGEKSFVECGRDFTLLDLIKITKEIESFLTGLLDGMTEYYDNNKWILSETMARV